MKKSIDALDVPWRTVVLLSDSAGAYGIGINPSAWVRAFIRNEHSEHKTCERIEEKVDELMQGLYRPLVLRPDVIRASAVFPNKCRITLLHTIGNKRWTGGDVWGANKCWAGGYEWAQRIKSLH